MGHLTGGTSLEQGLDLDEAQAPRAARDDDDLVPQAELGQQGRPLGGIDITEDGRGVQWTTDGTECWAHAASRHRRPRQESRRWGKSEHG